MDDRVYVLVNAIKLEPFEISSWNFYGSKILPLSLLLPLHGQKLGWFRQWLHSDAIADPKVAWISMPTFWIRHCCTSAVIQRRWRSSYIIDSLRRSDVQQLALRDTGPCVVFTSQSLPVAARAAIA